MVLIVFVHPDHCGNSSTVTMLILVGEGLASIGPSSNSMGSMVEDKPLSQVFWVVVSDSHSVLVMSDVLAPEEGSVALHSRLQLELDSVLERLSWVLDSIGVELPALVSSFVACPEDGVSLVTVVSSMNIQAFLRVVPKVLPASLEVGDFLVVLTNPWSDACCNSDSVSISILIRDGVVSLGQSSDCLCSPVESEPLLGITWHMVLDSQSPLVSTDMFSPVEGPESRHLGSDLELLAVGKRVGWIVCSCLVDVPGLVHTVMAVPPGGMLSIYIFTSPHIKALSIVVHDASQLA